METLARQAFLTLYNGQVEAIFRYHLVRGGDWTAALSMTADTFHSALDWFDPQRVNPGMEVVWLWKIAVTQQARQNPRADGLQYAGQILPDQAQISTFAQTVQVMSQWQPLSRQQRDILALFFFGGLSPEQVSLVVGGNGDRIREIAAQHGSPALFELSRDVRPVGYFQQRLENGLGESMQNLPKPRLRLNRPLFWQPSYHARSILVWALRLSVVGVLVYLLATAWNSFQHASSPLPGPAPTPARLPKITETPEFVFAPLLDDIIVADPNDQLRVFSLTEAKFGPTLSQAGFYPNKHVNPIFSPQISPDGKWLSLGRPLQDDTWLLSLDGKHQILIAPQQVKLSWSPDSLKLISINPHQSGRVDEIDVESAVSTSLFENARAQILAATYSPHADRIGIAYLEGGRLRLDLLSTSGKSRRQLASLPVHTDLSPGSFELFFTADGKEIWLPALRSAVTVPEGEVRPLESEPSGDQTGARGQRLGLNELPPLTESSVLSPDGYKAAVILRRIDTDAPSILTIYNGPRLATQRWMTYYGQIDALAWAVDSTRLFIQREGALGPAILQIDAQSGKNVVLLDQFRLIGTLSALRQASYLLAPRTDLIKGDSSSGTDNKLMTADLPGNQLSFRIPQSWRLWTQDNGLPPGTAIAANFSFADSLGWAALPPGYVMIGISLYTWNESRPLAQQVESYAGTQPGQADVKRINLDGNEAYRLDFLKEDGTREPVVYFRTGSGDVAIWMMHGANQVNPYFDTFLKSVRINAEQPVSQAEITPSVLYP